MGIRTSCTAPALAVAEGLRFILHLIGLIREDVGPSAIRQTSTLHFDGGVRARRLVQTFVFVVAAMAWEQAVPPPHLHGVGGDLQAVGHLVPGQQPAGPESLIEGAEVVAMSDVFHDAALKRLPRA